MLFDYKGTEKDGAEIYGVVEAGSEEEASVLLEDEGIFVVSITPRGSNILSRLVGFEFRAKVGRKDVVIFSRQLSVMISATLPIVKALRILVRQTESVGLKRIVSEIADDIEAGSKLSLAFAKHPGVFDNFYVNMVRSGETSGKLGDVLSFLADQQEKDYDLMSKIKGAMIYPVFILTGLFVVGIIMMVWVVPKITELVRDLGSELPLSTRILISVSDFMVSYWWVVVLLVVGGIVGARFYFRTQEGQRNKDWLLLRIPIFKNMFQKIYLVRFTRGLSTLIVGKVPLTLALTVVAGLVGNRIYEELILNTIKEVEDGNSISTVFAKSPVIPNMLTNMLSVGEQTGRLEEVLDKMTDFYGRELDNMIANLVSLIEPLILVIMGVGVGGMVAAVLMPMFNLASQL
ncbi:MAG: hypothetical protein G01um101418_613 [Parcubacteria group bacterium Gr01-1014_18]|nr:MAG: hypothetical protein Greene041636_96 [Parcubacteria group bacterium Greene0416_36]TSC80865.1 MAG: hypothetical protein G01um101418_613 [Parcubacteria group bacterium Gr01-1014_18]TSC99526.1 MAG: hypothetical protein Greene101420_193 [Parcubacteria group bacterium Greene1014_20]TSD07555.1 MAG: hypothetical protein Greene07142_12 [Parcubacteria group bacterium Greene0714_2]